MSRGILDHRSFLLLPPGLVAWLVALVLPRGPAWLPWASAGVAAGAVGVALRLWTRHPTAMRVAAAAVAGVVVLVSVSTGVHLAVRDAGPWQKLIDQRALVVAEIEVVTPARAVTGGPLWQADVNRQRFVAQVRQIHTATETWRLGSTVGTLAILPPSAELLGTGDRLTGDFRVSSPQQPHLGHSATLMSTGEPGRVRPDTSWTSAVVDRLAAALPVNLPEQSSLVLGMVFGDDSGLSEDSQQAMRSSGLSHLTAVSGANIALVCGAVLVLARLVGFPGRAALVPALAVVAAYVAVVGPEPSVVRATAMALVAIAGLWLGGGTGFAALAVALSALLTLDPWLASSRGFALSCAATAGLILVAVPGRTLVTALAGRVPTVARLPVAAVLASVLTAAAAGLATMPLIAAYGQGISLLSVLANVAAAPLVGVVTVSGLIVAMLAWVQPGLAAAAGAIPTAGAGWILAVAEATSGVPGGRFRWPAGFWPAAALVVTMGAVAVLGRRWRALPILVPTAVALGSIVAAVVPAALPAPAKDWQVVVCDVGQGDAVLLRAGPESAVLVDAGPTPEGAVDCLRRNGISHVPAVILSHFHADHVTGVGSVAERFGPPRVLVSPLPEPAQTYDATLESLSAGGSVTLDVAQLGQQFTAGWVRLTVLGPARIIDAGSVPNNASLVLSATIDSPRALTRVLLTGDIEPEAQRALMSSAPPLKVDLAKVPHHGSANQHPRFARWAGADVAVVSSGADNDYGHPAAETVTSWEASGAAVVRTDQHGDVIAVGGDDGSTTVVTMRVRDRP